MILLTTWQGSSTRRRKATLTLLCPSLPQVNKWEKCGGSGGNNRQDDGACCTSGFFCARINNWHWQCEASTGTNTNTVVVTGTINLDGKSVPLCTNAAAANVVDKQGRKWGWENNQSCVVVG